jgi:hypothetical protein
MAHGAAGIHLDVKHPLRYDSTVAGSRDARILNRMLQIKENSGQIPWIAFVHKHRASPQQVAMSFQNEIER